MKKYILAFMCALSLSAQSYAADIKIGSVSEYRSYIVYLKQNIQASAEFLREHMTQNLKCSNVKLCLVDHKEVGFLASLTGLQNYFTTELTATCPDNIKSMYFAIYPPFDWEEDLHVELNYKTENGPQKVFETLENANTYGSSNKDNMPNCF